MPHYTVMIGSDSPTIDLAVAVSRVWQRRRAAQGRPMPSPTTVRGLIDTGSDLSVVHPQILQQLSLQAVGSVRIRRPGAGGGFRLAAIFDVQLLIGGAAPDAHWISTQVVSAAPSTPTVLALIGRDVLEQCTLFYNGPRRELTLSC